mmetsp:Transcript_7110/g.16400  ORF Transcript_7110/g.16400 Transcript_7110/m.16400 type:complete len:244 (+) Transcript_7110:904-1635(+)
MPLSSGCVKALMTVTCSSRYVLRPAPLPAPHQFFSLAAWTTTGVSKSSKPEPPAGHTWSRSCLSWVMMAARCSCSSFMRRSCLRSSPLPVTGGSGQQPTSSSVTRLALLAPMTKEARPDSSSPCCTAAAARASSSSGGRGGCPSFTRCFSSCASSFLFCLTCLSRASCAFFLAACWRRCFSSRLTFSLWCWSSFRNLKQGVYCLSRKSRPFASSCCQSFANAAHSFSQLSFKALSWAIRWLKR